LRPLAIPASRWPRVVSALLVLGLSAAGAVRAEEAPAFRLGVMVEQPADPARIIEFNSALVAQL